MYQGNTNWIMTFSRAQERTPQTRMPAAQGAAARLTGTRAHHGLHAARPHLPAASQDAST